MLQNPCKTLGFKKNMVYKIPPGGEVNHIQPVAYSALHFYSFNLVCNMATFRKKYFLTPWVGVKLHSRGQGSVQEQNMQPPSEENYFDLLTSSGK